MEEPAGDEPVGEGPVVEPVVDDVVAGAVELVDDDGLVDEEVEDAPPPVPEELVEVVEVVGVVGGVAAGRLFPPWVARAATLAIRRAAMARAAARIVRPPTIGT